MKIDLGEIFGGNTLLLGSSEKLFLEFSELRFSGVDQLSGLENGFDHLFQLGLLVNQIDEEFWEQSEISGVMILVNGLADIESHQKGEKRVLQ